MVINELKCQLFWSKPTKIFIEHIWKETALQQTILKKKLQSTMYANMENPRFLS